MVVCLFSSLSAAETKSAVDYGEADEPPAEVETEAEPMELDAVEEAPAAAEGAHRSRNNHRQSAMGAERSAVVVRCAASLAATETAPPAPASPVAESHANSGNDPVLEVNVETAAREETLTAVPGPAEEPPPASPVAQAGCLRNSSCTCAECVPPVDTAEQPVGIASTTSSAEQPTEQLDG
jgi:hypothetical protein